MNGSTLSAHPTTPDLHPGPPRLSAGGGPGRGRPVEAWIVAASLFLLCVASILPSWIYYRSIDQPVPWSRLVSEAFSWLLWLALLPVVVRASRRFPVDRRTWGWALPAHAGIGALVAAAYTLLVVVKNQAILAAATGLFAHGFLTQFPGYLVGGFQSYLLVYGTIVAATHAYDGFRRLKEKEITSSRLEADLTRAQLQVLKTQLEPHFLFNTLNAISALVHGNPDTAEKMVVRLSELLRLSLAAGDREEVALDEDLRFLGIYLDIQRIRFGERLRVDLDVEDAARSASVPNLLLQPLVENAIRHGLEKRAAPLAITIRARRATHGAGLLELDVLDDGPGLPEEAPRRNGVGLANTRARLERLYGEAHRFEIGNRPEGGVRVHLEIPQTRSA